MSTFSGATKFGIVLGTGTYTNPLTITSTGYVNNTTAAYNGDAVYGPTGTAWTLYNYGRVNATQASASGVHLAAGGTITNGITNGTAGSITGVVDGILITGAAGAVFNSATIVGKGATGNGVYITAGGELSNASTGIITGYDGVRIGGGVGTLVNSGSIVSTGAGFGAQGVDFLGGGTLTNYGSILGVGYHASGINAGFSSDTIINGAPANTTALIEGQLNGIDQFSGVGTIINFATVISTGGDGVYLQAGGTVTNSGIVGLIQGSYDAVRINGGAGVVGNLGTIAGTGAFADGVALFAGGSVSNGAAGVSTARIEGSGRRGVFVYGGAGTVTNYGTILSVSASYVAVYLKAGGTVINHAGALISASSVDGIAIGHGRGTVINDGSINGIYLIAGGLVTNTGQMAAQQVVLVNGGDGTVSNSGSIAGTGATGQGVYLKAGGTVTNNGGISGANDVVRISGAVGTVNNSGTIAATGGTALWLDGAGGTVVNSGLLTGTGDVLFTNNGLGKVVNDGRIIDTGASGAGVCFDAGGYLGNSASGYITAPDIGVEIQNAAGTVVNSGTIASSGGSSTGVYLAAGGYAGNVKLISAGADGVVIGGALGSVANSGTVLGPNLGVWLKAGGTVSNSPTGLIADNGAGGDGVTFGTGSGGAGNLYNAGTVSGHNLAVWLNFGGVATNAASGLISGGNIAVEIDTKNATVINFGTISQTNAAAGIGVSLSSGGTVVNHGTIGSAHGTAAVFGGGANRLVLYPGAVFIGSVTATGGTLELAATASTGTISGVGGNFYGFNTLTFDAGARWVAGGVAAGLATEAITGFAPTDRLDITDIQAKSYTYSGGVLTLKDGSGAQVARLSLSTPIVNPLFVVTSDGAGGTDVQVQAMSNFTGTYLNGIVLNTPATQNPSTVTATAYVTNQGPSYGGDAVYGTNATAWNFVNLGTIKATQAAAAGVHFVNGGTVENGGLISAVADGVLITGAPGWVDNYGTIAGTGPSGEGIVLTAGGTVTNSASIAGVGNGVYIGGGVGTVANDGTISASGTNNASVFLSAGGTVTNGTSFLPNALITGNTNAVAIFNAPGSVTNYGTIAATGTAGYGVVISNGGIVSNYGSIVRSGTAGAAVRLDAGGTIANSGLVSGAGLGLQVVGGAGTISNSGTILAPGSIVNGSGTLTGGNAVFLNKGGILTNSATGLIEGYHFGVQASAAAAATVVNSGTIKSDESASNASVGEGVVLSGGGLVTNSGLIQAVNGNAVLTGSTAGGVGTIINLGIIRTTGSLLSPTGGHMNPIVMSGGGTIINGAPTLTSALITGYERAIYGGGNSNVQIPGAVVTLVNYGTISGSGTGANAAPDISLVAGAVITNRGLITSPVRNGINIGTTSFASAGTVSNYGTVFSGGTFNSAIYLAAGGRITNAAGGNITANWSGVDTRNVSATVTNFGTIVSNGTTLVGTVHATGVVLEQGGTVINGSTASSAALITGYEHAIYIGGAFGTAHPGAIGVVFNYGIISGTGTGASATQALVLSSGGTINNHGSITDATQNAVQIRGSVASTVTNYGLIKNFTTAHGAVYSMAGGLVSNAAGGTIASGRSAVSFNDTAGTTVSFGTVLNAGTIISTGTTAGSGVYFGQGGVLSNTGRITAIRSGVSGSNSAATVTNYGTISSTGPSSCGVELAGGGLVINGATGLISGATGVAIAGTAAGVVANLGTITGNSSNGVTLSSGGVVDNGTAVIITGAARGSGAAVTGAWINGALAGVAIGGGTAASGSVVNFSTITGGTGGVAFFTNGVVSNDTVGFIAGGYGIGAGTGAAASAIYNLGTIIGTASRGIHITSGGTISNGAGGLIAGVTGGVYASAAGLAVTNSGTILSSTARGVSFAAGGVLNNGGSVTGAGGGAYFFGAAGTLTNGGTIASTGSLFDGVYMGSGGVINNGGVIAGLDAIDLRGSGSIGNSGTIIGSGSGNIGGIFLGFNYSPGAFKVTNTGLITSTATAVLMRGSGTVTNAAGGVITGGEFAVQVFGASTITNFGTIASAAGSAGTAIRLGASADTVVLEQGSVLTGAIANFGAGDTIDLPFIPFSASDTATLDSSNLLTVSGGGKTATVQLDSAVAGKVFTVVSDGAGGADVQLKGPSAPTGLTLAAGSDSGVKGDNITNIATPTITGLGEAGDTVTLLDGTTAIGTAMVLGDATWSVTSKTLSAGVHSLTATEKDASGLVSASSAILSLTIDQSVPSASPAKLTVPSNGGPTAIGILAPSDPDDPAASLSIIVGTLPTNGTVTLADGTTPITVGESLSIAQLTTLKFAPAAGQIGVSSSLVYSVSDVAGNTTSGSAALTVGANSVTRLFDFLFLYNDGKDYYGGSVADDGTFGYTVGQTITTSAGKYTIFNEEASVTSQASGTVIVASYSHNGPGAASQVPITTASGKPDGSKGLGSESDAVLGVDGKAHPFSSTLEASFATSTLFGFVYTYADGAAVYTGSVADDGSAGLANGSMAVTDGSGHLVGTYTLFSEGPTGLAAGTVVIDRFLSGGASFIPVHASSSGIDGTGGLKSEAASITVGGATLPFSDTQEPAVPGALATAPVISAPTASDVISQELNEIYHAVLGRDPDPGGLATYSAALASGTSAATIRAIIAGSAEARSDVNQLYRQIFGRDGDTGGLDTYVHYLATGGSLAGVQLILAQSPEAQNAIAEVYLDVLNRTADPGGLATYAAALANETPTSPLDPAGRPGLDGVRDVIAHSGEAADSLTALFQSVLARPPGAAELIGMEDRLATAGVTQTTLKNALLSTGSAGGFSVITAPSGSATLPAAFGVPTLFVFSDIAFGNDTVTGFDTRRDTIQLSKSTVSDFTKLQSETTSSGGNSLITLSPSQSILISGVAPSSLGSANFRFV